MTIEKSPITKAAQAAAASPGGPSVPAAVDNGAVDNGANGAAARELRGCAPNAPSVTPSAASHSATRNGERPPDAESGMFSMFRSVAGIVKRA